MILVNFPNLCLFNCGAKLGTMLRSLCLWTLIILGFCCKKQTCEGNCAGINISGRLVDSSGSIGLAGVPIKVYWQDRGICYVCPEIDVSKSKTDRDGNFSFTISVDTSRFGGYALYVSIPIPSGYIPDGYLGEPINQEYVLKESFSSYAPSFSNIRFVLYQKTDLSIQLLRAQSDIFTSLDIDYRYDFTYLGLYTYTGPPPADVESFKIVTAANVFTKILLVKAYGFGQTSTFTDSIKCTSNSNNKIVITY